MTNEEAIKELEKNRPEICKWENYDTPDRRLIDVIPDHETTFGRALDMAIKALGKGINVPTNSALDHIHNVVAENSFNEGYDAGHKEGYERGKADAALSASTLAKRLMEKFDDVLSVSDVLEELKQLEAATKGE